MQDDDCFLFFLQGIQSLIQLLILESSISFFSGSDIQCMRSVCLNRLGAWFQLPINVAVICNLEQPGAEPGKSQK